jgi:hypothetical protein
MLEMQPIEHSRCLHESEPFAHLNRQLVFMRQYWYAFAIAPFAVTIFVLLRFYGTSTNRLLDIPIYVTLGWALLVAFYSLALIVRVLFIRCPKCGWLFGGGDKCGSCGFPRQLTSSLS